jgi:copper chaperone NosL
VTGAPAARAAAALSAALALRCGAGAPAAVDVRNDACAFCRMPVSDPKLAAQLAAPSEEPRLFDDVGCLRDYLAGHPSLPARSAAYVADHATGRWVPASSAVYERCPGLQTPMGSHLIAFDPASAAGAAGSGCERLTAAAVFGAAPPPGGSR